MSISFRHIGLVTQNYEESKRFYLDVLGMSILSEAVEEGTYIESMLNLPKGSSLQILKMNYNSQLGFIVEIISPLTNKVSQYPKSLTTEGATHFAVTVSNADDYYHKLNNAGYPPLSEPVITPSGAKVFFVRTPEGAYIEFVEITIMKKE